MLAACGLGWGEGLTCGLRGALMAGGGAVLLQSEVDKLKFLRAVETLSGAVRAQADGTMDNYFPKTILAKKIEVMATLMLLGGGPPGMRRPGPDLRARVSL